MNYIIPDYQPTIELSERIKLIQKTINKLNKLRDNGFSKELKDKIFTQIKISHIYNSNAIEGNKLTLRETEVILKNMELNDKPLKDQIEAKTLSTAYDFLFDLISGKNQIDRNAILMLHSMLMKEIDIQIAGIYRKGDVKIGGSKHVPPSWADVNDHMEIMLEWFRKNNSYPIVVKSAILHHWFVWIHPFSDGNGRVSRLLLNFFLLQSGFPEVVIRIEDRDEYYNSLSAADSGNITDIVDIISNKILETSSIYEEFINEEEREKQWIKKYTHSEVHLLKEKERFNYEVFKSQLEVFRARFEQLVSSLQDRIKNIKITMRHYEIISVNKYIDILEGGDVSNTWYFTLRLSEYQKEDLLIIFYFERFYPKVESYGGKKKNIIPFVKLYYSIRRNGHQLSINYSIKLYNVGVNKDRLIFGTRNKDNPRKISSIETLPGDIIREFIDQIIISYFK